MLKGFREKLLEVFVGDDPQEKREFLSKFIDRIEIGEEKLTIYYFAPNPSFLGIKKSPTEDVTIVGGVWLPFVDTYRTQFIVPTKEIKTLCGAFHQLVSV